MDSLHRCLLPRNECVGGISIKWMSVYFIGKLGVHLTVCMDETRQ